MMIPPLQVSDFTNQFLFFVMSNLQLQETEEGHILYSDTEKRCISRLNGSDCKMLERRMRTHTSDFSTPDEFDSMHPASTARLAEKIK